MSQFEHQPVLLHEVMAALNPVPGGRYVDGTIGGAGHAMAILRLSSPDGWLFGCDRDAAAIQVSSKRLEAYSGRFEIRHGSFAQLAEWVQPASCDGVLLDLGVSSYLLAAADRGFSFQTDGPLDMRMDARQSLTAADIVNTASAEELAAVFRDLGGERDAWRLARAIARDREQHAFHTTLQLAGLIERVSPRRGARTHPATKVFQALRMRVNDEPESLNRGLRAAWSVLRPGGRLAVICFHSGEERAVKEFGRPLERPYAIPGDVDIPELRQPRPAQLAWLARKATCPGAAEVLANPRARSARLRVMRKLEGTPGQPGAR